MQNKWIYITAILAAVGLFLFLKFNGCIRIPIIGQAPTTVIAPAGSTITESPTDITIKDPAGHTARYTHRPEARPQITLPGPGDKPGTPAKVIIPHSGFCIVPAAGIGWDTQVDFTVDAGVEFAYLNDLLGLEADVATSLNFKDWRQSLRLNARPFGANFLISAGPSGKLGTLSVDGIATAVKVALWD